MVADIDFSFWISALLKVAYISFKISMGKRRINSFKFHEVMNIVSYISLITSQNIYLLESTTLVGNNFP